MKENKDYIDDCFRVLNGKEPIYEKETLKELKERKEPKKLTDEEIAIKLEEIEREETKQETLEEAAEKYANKKGAIQTTELEDAIFKQGFIDGAKWQEKRMYSEEEVLTFLNAMISEIEIRKHNIISNSDKMEIHLLEGGCIAFESSKDVIKKTFEQFKKK